MSLVKKDIVKNISIKAHIPLSYSHNLTDSFFYLLKFHSNNKHINIPNFGSFYRKVSPDRVGRNPKTKEEFLISSRSKLSFSPSNNIKKIIN